MQKPIRISEHAKRRMMRYELTDVQITQAIRKPDEVVKGHHGRKIAHKLMNDYVLRVIYDENDIVTVVTAYPARRERYAAKKVQEG